MSAIGALFLFVPFLSSLKQPPLQKDFFRVAYWKKTAEIDYTARTVRIMLFSNTPHSFNI